ncbi:MAG: 2Fe-2S iron-sulfur cluster-binding protein [Boseongicola sp.]|nr:2Fe-2S iron-sulfur cluster-binding protein [Boseongicola sp.]
MPTIAGETPRAGVELSYGCKYGGCITCAAKLTAGIVNRRRQVALIKRQINAGYVILCVARPMSDITLEIGVDSHGEPYRTLSSTRWNPMNRRQASPHQELDDGP